MEYFVRGSGPEPLISFHGFGQTATDYTDFAEILGGRFTLVLVNLFYHGKSHSEIDAEKDFFDEKALKKVIGVLLDRLKIERTSLMGFSLGGRICLKLIESMPERINRAILLAPDGLRMSSWYRFVTANRYGHALFKKTVKDPSRLIAISGLITRLGLLNEKKHAFTLQNFNSPEKRKQVYDVWMIYRLLIPDPDTVCAQSKRNGISIDLYFGKYDTIIPPEFGRVLTSRLHSNLSVNIVDCGHQMLKRKTAEMIFLNSGSIK